MVCPPSLVPPLLEPLELPPLLELVPLEEPLEEPLSEVPPLPELLLLEPASSDSPVPSLVPQAQTKNAAPTAMERAIRLLKAIIPYSTGLPA
jgi:hypothetical protein